MKEGEKKGTAEVKTAKNECLRESRPATGGEKKHGKGGLGKIKEGQVRSIKKILSKEEGPRIQVMNRLGKKKGSLRKKSNNSGNECSGKVSLVRFEIFAGSVVELGCRLIRRRREKSDKGGGRPGCSGTHQQFP